MIDAALAGRVFHRSPKPDMFGDHAVPVTFAYIVAHQGATLRQHLINVPIRRFHRVKDSVHKSPVYALMEQVAHRIDEDHAWLLPPRWLRETRRPQAKVEPLLVGVALDSAPPLGEPLRVAVVAPRSDLRAAGHGVSKSRPSTRWSMPVPPWFPREPESTPIRRRNRKRTLPFGQRLPMIQQVLPNGNTAFQVEAGPEGRIRMRPLSSTLAGPCSWEAAVLCARGSYGQAKFLHSSTASSTSAPDTLVQSMALTSSSDGREYRHVEAH